MKLYVREGELFFDYSDVDVNARLDAAGNQSRHFLMETNCWDKTEMRQLVKMSYEPYSWASEYENARAFENLLKKCVYTAKKFALIEISPEVSDFLTGAAQRCYELYKIEEEKEAQRRAKDKWQELCKYGCGRCPNKMRSGDDHICVATKEILHETNVPTSYGKVNYLFNYVAFPTENCPYNVNKPKEAI